LPDFAGDDHRDPQRIGVGIGEEVLCLEAGGIEFHAGVLGGFFIEVGDLAPQCQLLVHLVLELVFQGELLKSVVFGCVKIVFEGVLQLQLSDRIGVTVFDERIRLDGQRRRGHEQDQRECDDEITRVHDAPLSARGYRGDGFIKSVTGAAWVNRIRRRPGA
jgi:hypothetical protein